MREDAGGRLVALLRSKAFCADPLELRATNWSMQPWRDRLWSPMEPVVIAVRLLPF